MLSSSLGDTPIGTKSCCEALLSVKIRPNPKTGADMAIASFKAIRKIWGLNLAQIFVIKFGFGGVFLQGFHDFFGTIHIIAKHFRSETLGFPW
jgi:hypothetical protein